MAYTNNCHNEGESLFNDASTLLVYRLAVGATLTGVLSGWSVLPTLLVVTLGSIVLALILAQLTLAVNARIRDVSTAVVVQFCTAFGVWMLAERLHLSGIITLVVFAMAASRRTPEVMPARIRIPSWRRNSTGRSFSGRGSVQKARRSPRSSWPPSPRRRGLSSGYGAGCWRAQEK